MRILIALPLAALAIPFSSCQCDDQLHGLPVPHAQLSNGDQVEPPSKLVDVAAPTVSLGANQDTVLTLKNTGNAPLHVTGIVLGGDATLCAQPSAAFFLTTPSDAQPFDVAPNSKHDIPVRFAPTTAAPSCVIVTVGENDADHPTLLARINEQGDAPQLCADKQVVDFGDVVVGDSKNDTVTLTSCGTQPINLASITENASFPDPFGATLPTVPATLAVGDAVQLPVTFTPQEPGSWSIASGGGVVTVVDDVGTQYTITLVGTAHEPPRCHIQIVPSAVNFGQVAVSHTAQQPVIIKNIGALPCTFTSADVVTGDPFTRDLTSITAGQTLQPQDAGTVTVTFAPLAAAGQQNDVLRVLTDDPVTPSIDVPLQGNSVDITPCFLQADPSALNFGAETLHRSTTRTVAMENIGTDMCMITAIELTSGAPDFSIVAPTLSNLCSGPNPQVPPQFCQIFGNLFGTMVGPGDHVDFVVTFRPESEGDHSGDVQFTYKLGGQPGQTNPDQLIDVPLSGTGIPPCISVSPQDVDFGSVAVGATSPQTVTVSNCGGGDLVVRGLSMR
ncbi:MAG TPA: choice-of-anchor D domain-containing protein, partial [Myxococcota bacterium]